MEFEVGSVLTGKVTSITKFGAFVSLESGRSGLVHISEIANTYVSDISDFLKVGQEVSVKVISIDDAGRINLSIKQTQEPASTRQRRFEKSPQRAEGSRAAQPHEDAAFNPRRSEQHQGGAPTASAQYESDRAANISFEDKLKRFMQDSDSKISGLYAERKSSRRRSRG